MAALAEHQRRKGYYAVDLGTFEISQLPEFCGELITMPEGGNRICAAIIDALSRKDIIRADVLSRFVHPSVLNIVAKQKCFIENNYENTPAVEWFLKEAHPYVCTYIPIIKNRGTNLLNLAKWTCSKKMRTEGLRTITSDDLIHRKEEIIKMLTWLKENDTYPLNALSLMTQACRTGEQETVLRIEQICGEITQPHRSRLGLVAIGHGSVEFVKWILQRYWIEIKQISDYEISYSLTSNTKAATISWLITELKLGQKYIERCMIKSMCENNLEVVKALHKYFSKEEMERLAENILYPNALMRWMVESHGFGIFTSYHLTKLAVKADGLTTALQLADEAQKRSRSRSWIDAAVLAMIARMTLTAQEIIMLMDRLGAITREKWALVGHAISARRKDIVKELAKQLEAQDKASWEKTMRLYMKAIAIGVDMLETLYEAGFVPKCPPDTINLDILFNFVRTLDEYTLPLDWFMEKFNIESIGPVNPEHIIIASYMGEGDYAMLKWMQKWHEKNDPASLKAILEILIKEKQYEAVLGIISRDNAIYRKVRVACEKRNADEALKSLA